MRNRLLIPVALSLALAAGTAHAQVVQGGYINGFPAYGLAPPPVPPGIFGNFNAQPSFFPNAGFGNQGNFVPNPGSIFPNSSNFVPFQTPPSAFTPGPRIQAFPGYGGGFYGSYGYPGYGYGYPGGYYTYYTNGYPPEYYGNNGPVVDPGVVGNAPVPQEQPEVVPPVNNGPNASTRTPEERRALLAMAQRERDEEARVAKEYQSLVAANALAPGTLVSVQNGTVRVRYQENGSRKIGRFSPRQVFFTAFTRSSEGDRVATLATDPGLKQQGDRVMVALPPVTATRSGDRIVITNQ
jgi:hypothetical protein